MTELDRPIKTLLRDPPAPDAQALWHSIAARRRPALPRRTRPTLVAAAFGILTAAVITFGLRAAWFRPAALSLADGGPLHVLQTQHAATTLALSDGSRIELAPNTRLVPRSVNGRLFAAELAAGSAAFDVVPGGPRRWLITAADVQVSVLGTRFRVERTGLAVNVSVERGVVEVTGPNVPHGSRRLFAREQLSIPSTPLAVVRAPQPSPPTAAVVTESYPADAQKPDARSQPDAPVSPTLPAGRREARTADAILAGADAAREAGHPARAAALLTRLIDRYPTDPRAALAAFTLGQLYLEQLASPARAAQAFERAQLFGLPQALAEDGAARLVEAYAKAGQFERAQTAAAAYRAHFPQGPRRHAIDAWTTTP
jgi:transmembrane sensor